MQDIEIDVGEFYLRTLNIDEDLTNYCYWMSNPQNNEYIVSAHTDYGLLKLQQFIEDCNSDNSTILLGIFDKYKNTHIGNIKFDRIDSKNGSATMGILIGEKKYRGRGLAGKVIKSSVNWLNCNLDIKKF
jgi:RimJ/RimL family protein N-acetyltransferase